MNEFTIADQVVCLRAGEYDCFVGGKLYGTWRSAAEAALGMKVEQLRAAKRNAEEAAA